MKDIEKRAIFWNTLAGLVNAGQSSFLLFFIARCCGVITAGIYSFAFANANLLLCIGKYGLRKFQITDTSEEYSFAEYFISRIITSVLMAVGLIAFLVYTRFAHDYSIEKTLVIIGMAILKIIDAIDDIFLGMFHQKGRLDIGARNSCLRNIFTIISMAIMVFITHELIISIVVGIIVSVCGVIIAVSKSYHCVTNKPMSDFTFKNVFRLLIFNFPLVAGDCLLVYIGNAPKYSIDKYLSEDLQGYYGIISLPILIISLLSDFIFMPFLVHFAEAWNEKNIRRFNMLLFQQLIAIMFFSVIIIFIGYWAGIPILSFIYKVELSEYGLEFVILLLGGAFSAIFSLLYTLVTVIRYQRCIIPIYLLTAFVVAALSSVCVKSFELLGACYIYFGASVILTLLFASVLFFKERNNNG